MKIKLILFITLLLITLFTGIYISEYKDVYFTSEKYQFHIGRISPEGAVQLDSIKNYNGQSIVGYWSSSAPEIYKGSKYQFKKNILANYDGEHYSDFGYLNYRFYINDKGKVIMYKINPMNMNLESSKMNDSLISDITKLVIQKKHWYPILEEETTYYMHLTFKIENGEITEIIP